MARDRHIIDFCRAYPWAIEESVLPILASVIARHVARVDASAEIAAAIQSRKDLPQPRAGSVAVIPVHGVIAPRMTEMSAMSGGTSCDAIEGRLHEAMANPDVRTIVFDVDSPGGSVAGITELAAQVRAARAQKPVVAVAQYRMASAAFWAMSGATEIVAAPSAMVGSLGIVTAHVDLSEALAKEGIKKTYLSAGDGKADGNETGPLDPEVEARVQAQLDQVYGQMVTDVVRGRGEGMTAAKVRKDVKAHMYSAADALALGMIDRIATLNQTLGRLLGSSSDATDRKAARAYLETADTQDPARDTVQAATPQEQNAVVMALLELGLL
jgi:signal peptide peptidase SppA